MSIVPVHTYAMLNGGDGEGEPDALSVLLAPEVAVLRSATPTSTVDFRMYGFNGATTADWDYGDGHTETQPIGVDTSRTFDAPGIYTVSATTDKGDTASTEAHVPAVRVYPALLGEFSVDAEHPHGVGEVLMTWFGGGQIFVCDEVFDPLVHGEAWLGTNTGAAVFPDMVTAKLALHMKGVPPWEGVIDGLTYGSWWQEVFIPVALGGTGTPFMPLDHRGAMTIWLLDAGGAVIAQGSGPFETGHPACSALDTTTGQPHGDGSGVQVMMQERPGGEALRGWQVPAGTDSLDLTVVDHPEIAPGVWYGAEPAPITFPVDAATIAANYNPQFNALWYADIGADPSGIQALAGQDLTFRWAGFKGSKEIWSAEATYHVDEV
jgi:hypothetical protein